MDSKEKILLGLKRLLLTKGHRGYSVRALAKEAEVNHGLVHHYFGSKEGVVRALLAQITGEKLRQLVERIEAGAPEEFGEFFVDLWVKDEEFARLIYEFGQLGRQFPAIGKIINEIAEKRRYFLTQVFELSEAQAMLIQAVIFGIQTLRQDLPIEQIRLAAEELFRIFPLDKKFNAKKLK